jgi:hypothetical protein
MASDTHGHLVVGCLGVTACICRDCEGDDAREREERKYFFMIGEENE